MHLTGGIALLVAQTFCLITWEWWFSERSSFGFGGMVSIVILALQLLCQVEQLLDCLVWIIRMNETLFAKIRIYGNRTCQY